MRRLTTAATAGAVLLGSAALGVSAQTVAPTVEKTVAQAGRQKAAVCNVCHGALGVSGAPDTPHLAGQPAIYLSAQLKAYRSGERKHEVMAVMAKPLSDADINALAAWFASLQIEAKAP